MNKKEIVNARENARLFSYYNAKRRSLQNKKTILLNRIMKELSDENPLLSIAEQKKLAKVAPEYKNLLQAIKVNHKSESFQKWHLDMYFQKAEAFSTESKMNNSNNWNIHNI